MISVVILEVGLPTEAARNLRPPSFAKALEGNLLGCAAKVGGARRDRTDDLMLAKHALSQLSYGPVQGSGSRYQVSVIWNQKF